MLVDLDAVDYWAKNRFGWNSTAHFHIERKGMSVIPISSRNTHSLAHLDNVPHVPERVPDKDVVIRHGVLNVRCLRDAALANHEDLRGRGRVRVGLGLF